MIKIQIYYGKKIIIQNQKKNKTHFIFCKNEKTLLVADNIAKYYALNINTGEIIWSKNNTAPFNSQIKIYKDKFFVVDYNNTLRAYSIKMVLNLAI